MSGLSRTQVDKLGERLRTGHTSKDDLELLDEYRRSFAAAYAEVIRRIRETTGLHPTGRPAKSTNSVIEKLRREMSIRLSQMQDIAGCRIIVADRGEQDRLLATLEKTLGRVSVGDRRLNPSHGYRAVHAIVRMAGKSVEVQIRTAPQHVWAEISEKLSDVLDPAIKYGGGPAPIQDLLMRMSEGINANEELESNIVLLREKLELLRVGIVRHEVGEETLRDVESSQESMQTIHRAVLQLRSNIIRLAEELVSRVKKDGADDLLG